MWSAGSSSAFHPRSPWRCAANGTQQQTPVNHEYSHFPTFQVFPLSLSLKAPPLQTLEIPSPNLVLSLYNPVTPFHPHPLTHQAPNKTLTRNSSRMKYFARITSGSSFWSYSASAGMSKFRVKTKSQLGMPKSTIWAQFETHQAFGSDWTRQSNRTVCSCPPWFFRLVNLAYLGRE